VKSESFEGKWERRWHPLRREWVVYSAHRNTRPWDGASETGDETAAAYDPACYLCPDNVRVHGDRNPSYPGLYAFDNDHPVVGPEAPEVSGDHPLFQKASAAGRARVLCYDPRHNIALNDLALPQVAGVFHAFAEEMQRLARDPLAQFVLLFENKGTLTGTSSLHPHCQFYATPFVFKHIAEEMESAKQWQRDQGQNLFSEIIERELEEGTRVIAENDFAFACVPFFARYSYEVWLWPKRPVAHFDALSPEERSGLAAIYLEVTRRYDALFGISFPFVMSLYQAPVNQTAGTDYHCHFVFLPPLRHPNIKKFPAGPEIGGGNFMNDMMPEEAASNLRACAITAIQETR
jgi:UDPglucose--hexose-1-phosphate uridylyltransferase